MRYYICIELRKDADHVWKAYGHTDYSSEHCLKWAKERTPRGYEMRIKQLRPIKLKE